MLPAKLQMILPGHQSKACIWRAAQRRSPFWKGQHTVPMLCNADDGVLCGVFIIGTSPCSDRAAVRCFAAACSKEKAEDSHEHYESCDDQQPIRSSTAL